MRGLPRAVLSVGPGARPTSIADERSDTSRSSLFGFAGAHRMGIPVGVRTRNSRKPQKNRECEALYPYPAQPAMSDRFTVGRERPHSTGVESTIQWLSNQKSVSAASMRITRLNSGNAIRSRLFQPGCFGTYGNIAPSRERTNRSRRDSGVNPSSACATARQTSSFVTERSWTPCLRSRTPRQHSDDLDESDAPQVEPTASTPVTG